MTKLEKEIFKAVQMHPNIKPSELTIKRSPESIQTAIYNLVAKGKIYIGHSWMLRARNGYGPEDFKGFE